MPTHSLARQVPPSPRAIPLDPRRAAKHVGLRHVTDDGPGIRRIKRGAGFTYVGAHGRVLRDPRTLARIRSLVIPPAWTQVWICPLAEGHLQATGRDVRGRKQYRYHPSFRQVREEVKFEKMLAFATALPRIRSRCEEDLSKPGLPREKVLSTVVRLLEHTSIRVGNEEYTRANNSFGLTTLRDQHAKVRGASLHFRFRGKSGKARDVKLCDKRLARIVKRCQDLPGEVLFQYLDEQGRTRSVCSADVNAYLREVAGDDFTAKDFRTWNGSLLTALSLAEHGTADSATGAKKRIVEVVKATAERLGNTPAICRKCYIHPTILESYLAGQVIPRLTVASGRQSKVSLRPEEKALVAFLKRATRVVRRRAA